MRIAFSGHRDQISDTSSLDDIRALDPAAVWVHGGAQGFDSQVEAYAQRHNIQTVVIRPDYQKFGKGAPLKRNHQIIEGADMLVACYDGRKSGGTYYTLTLARKLGLPVKLTGIQK